MSSQRDNGPRTTSGRRISRKEKIWYLLEADRRYGPFSLFELREKYDRNELPDNIQVTRRRSNGEWRTWALHDILSFVEPLKPADVPHFAEPLVRAMRSISEDEDFPQSWSRAELRMKLPRLLRRHARELVWMGGVGAAVLATVLVFVGGVVRVAANAFDAYDNWSDPSLAEDSANPGKVKTYAGSLAAKSLRLPPPPPQMTFASQIPLPDVHLSPLQGCPRIAGDGFGLARAQDKPVTLSFVTLDTLPSACAPCHVRARLPDGTRLVLSSNTSRSFEEPRVGQYYQVCGQVTARFAGVAWVKMQNLRALR